MNNCKSRRANKKNRKQSYNQFILREQTSYAILCSVISSNRTQLTSNEFLWHLFVSGGGHTVNGELLHLHYHTYAHQLGQVVQDMLLHRRGGRRLGPRRIGSVHSGIRSGLCTSSGRWISLCLLTRALCLLPEICCSKIWKLRATVKRCLSVLKSKAIVTSPNWDVKVSY